MKRKIYWAGDRGFRACTRWHDEETIRILKDNYRWEVYYPFEEVGRIMDDKKFGEIFGRHGLLRNTCLSGIEECSIVVAYIGSQDAGTAQELEYATHRNRPILLWTDSAIVLGEFEGRNVSASQKEIEKLNVNLFPMNGMTAVFDRFIEFSKLGMKISPMKLAKIINKEANKVFDARNLGDRNT